VTLSDAKVMDFLGRNFVVGKKNIKGKTNYAGSSNTHLPTNAAMWVNNCSGHHNIQMFFLTADGRVLHCLPGYWGPKHFLEEAELAVELAKLFYAKDLSAAQRNEKYLNLHLGHAFEHAQELVGASHLQGFDRKYLEEKDGGDFKREKGFITSGLKTPDQVMHERLAEAPYVAFDSFDVKGFIDMGITHYKYDHGLPKKEMGCKCGKTCGCGENCSCAKKAAPKESKAADKPK
jgi:hypothetical protein